MSYHASLHVAAALAVLAVLCLLASFAAPPLSIPGLILAVGAYLIWSRGERRENARGNTGPWMRIACARSDCRGVRCPPNWQPEYDTPACDRYDCPTFHVGRNR